MRLYKLTIVLNSGVIYRNDRKKTILSSLWLRFSNSCSIGSFYLILIPCLPSNCPSLVKTWNIKRRTWGTLRELRFKRRTRSYCSLYIAPSNKCYSKPQQHFHHYPSLRIPPILNNLPNLDFIPLRIVT